MRSVVPAVLSVAVLGGMVAAGTGGAASITPKVGVFGSPATSVCLSGSSTPAKCNGRSNVFRGPDGKLAAGVTGVKTGCALIDQAGYVQAPSEAVVKGAISYAGPAQSYALTDTVVVKLKISVSATFTTSKTALVTYQVKLLSGKVPSCTPASFAKKTTTLKWFAKKDTGG